MAAALPSVCAAATSTEPVSFGLTGGYGEPAMTGDTSAGPCVPPAVRGTPVARGPSQESFSLTPPRWAVPLGSHWRATGTRDPRGPHGGGL
jgi:hypothetical protein